MIHRIDLVADTLRTTFVVDPVRAFEYKLAETEALEFASAGYTGTVPPLVAAAMLGYRNAWRYSPNNLYDLVTSKLTYTPV